MDDFILILKTKNECISVKKQIEIFLKSQLHLEFNNKSRFYPYKMGVNFCILIHIISIEKLKMN